MDFDGAAPASIYAASGISPAALEPFDGHLASAECWFRPSDADAQRLSDGEVDAAGSSKNSKTTAPKVMAERWTATPEQRQSAIGLIKSCSGPCEDEDALQALTVAFSDAGKVENRRAKVAAGLVFRALAAWYSGQHCLRIQ